AWLFPRPTRMETDYLKRCFGSCLGQALAEVAKARPGDPIEYLAHWLYHYRKTSKAKEEVGEKSQQKAEYENSLKKAKMTELLKQEESQIRQTYEKCHQPLISLASSTMKPVFIRENTKPLEKDALKPESLPGASKIHSEAFQHEIASRMHPGSTSP
ncbi:DYDC2 protein, partial [Crocuta crocuta]